MQRREELGRGMTGLFEEAIFESDDAALKILVSSGGHASAQTSLLWARAASPPLRKSHSQTS